MFKIIKYYSTIVPICHGYGPAGNLLNLKGNRLWNVSRNEKSSK
jgi:hypothetical protein